MKRLFAIRERISGWIDSVAAAVGGLLDRVSPPRVIRLVENDAGNFGLGAGEPAPGAIPTGECVRISETGVVGVMPERLATAVAGSRVELFLQPARFLFRPLELPERACEFLDGIARTQIDRLTPWNAADAAFGISAPMRTPPDRITVTIAATALTLVTPYVAAITALGAHSIAVFTTSPEANPGPGHIKVLERKARAALEAGRIRSMLVAILAAAAAFAGAAIAASAIVGASLEAQQGELARRLAATRAAATSARAAEFASLPAALRALELRKHESPASVLLLETLSQILPDHTYVTELRIEGTKLQLIGITRDAPSLIGILEQSARFTRATFFAPTTRSPSEQGERFHIEAQIKAAVAPRS